MEANHSTALWVRLFCLRSVPSGLYLWGKKSDSTNDMEPHPTVLESPHAVQRMVLNAGGNSLSVPSGTDLPTMCSCAENCHF